MSGLPPEVVRDALIMNALDKTREEIADFVSSAHDGDYSKGDVSAAINSVEAEADSADDPRQVYERYHMRGYAADMGDDLSAMLSTMAGPSQ